MRASGVRPVIKDWMARAELTENTDNKKAPAPRAGAETIRDRLVATVVGRHRNCIVSNDLFARTLS
ncbi:MAG: hypothetical protein QGG39_09430, partial [Candidatus Poribacteria bacterium]|nr:hypothetical protein [Candidatus Poribacteria bacterium]